MKTKILLLLASLGSLFACTSPLDDVSTIMVIDRNTTKESLASTISDLAKKNISVTIEDVSYNENGRVNSIKGKVEFEDGFVTFNSDKVGKIIVKKDLSHAHGTFGVIVRSRWF